MLKLNTDPNVYLLRQFLFYQTLISPKHKNKLNLSYKVIYKIDFKKEFPLNFF